MLVLVVVLAVLVEGIDSGDNGGSECGESADARERGQQRYTPMRGGYVWLWR